MMVNNVIPARAGELARAYALSREQPSVAFLLRRVARDRSRDGSIMIILLLIVAMPIRRSCSTR